MKTKLLRKVKKALKHFDISVIKISEHGYIKVIAIEIYNGTYSFYGQENYPFYTKTDFEKWKKEKYFVFYRSCIDYYKSYYNLISMKDKKILGKFGL